MGKKKSIFLLCTVLMISGTVADAAGESTPLRAVIFYQEQTWIQDINIMQQIAQSIQKNLEGHPEVALSCYGTENLSMTQSMKAAVNMKTDVMICYGVDSEEAKAGYKSLADHDIRIIMVDGDVEDSGRFAYIGTDNYGGGTQAAELVLNEKGKEAKVAMLAPSLDTGLRSVGARLDGFEDAAKENGMNIVAYCETTYDSLTAIEKIEVLLEENQDLEVLFCAEAVSGQAAADVVEEMGLKDQMMVITYDKNQRIEEDLEEEAIDVTLAQDTESIGKACADQLIALAAERTMESGKDAAFECIPITGRDLEGEKHES